MPNVMSSEIETPRDTTCRCFVGILRLRSASLRMTMRLHAAIFFTLGCAFAAAAQESPTSSPSTTPAESPSPLISPERSAVPPPAPAQTPSLSPARSARISFVPPPLEGTISLGIYDANGKLVRVLHQESDLREFTIGADALITQWDGKNDNNEDLPAGKYRARGYLVGHLKVEDLGHVADSSSETNPSTSVKVKLMPNPLANDKRSIINVAAGFDSDGSYLKTSDDLPLLTVSESPNLTRVLLTKAGDKSLDFWQNDETGFHRFRISNVNQMMAFDCGDFQLK